VGDLIGERGGGHSHIIRLAPAQGVVASLPLPK
jgi:hypothetical protein